MDKPKCTADECDKQARSHSAAWCEMHYYRLRRTGRLDRTATTVTLCAVPDCPSRATAHGLCGKHYQRKRKHGDPMALACERGAAGERHPQWKVEGTTYSGAHMRVRAQRGSARAHACVDCGGAARQWSYDHEDPNELASNEGAYSCDVDHYIPRCVPCHKIFDLGWLGSLSRGGGYPPKRTQIGTEGIGPR